MLVAGQRKERDEREEEETRENRGGGRDKREEEEEKQGVSKESTRLCLADCFLSPCVDSPPSSPVQSCRTPRHRPGLYAVLSQLALEESTVGGIIILHSTKAVE